MNHETFFCHLNKQENKKPFYIFCLVETYNGKKDLFILVSEEVNITKIVSYLKEHLGEQIEVRSIVVTKNFELGKRIISKIYAQPKY